MRTTWQILGLSLLGLICSSPVVASERVAFIVGNDRYPSVPLDNAVRDATAIRDMLRDRLGFKDDAIYFTSNIDRLGFFEKFEAFTKDAARADIVLFYFAGHGMESLDGRENFILPIDADAQRAAQSEAALRATGINLMTLSTDLSRVSSGAKIVLIDACRERPAGRTVTSRSGGGLAVYEDKRIPADTLMMLAAAPERVASDGQHHGPFTKALLEVLPKGGQDLMDAFFEVSDRVQEMTEKRQVPWMKFDGSGKIFRDKQFLAIDATPSTEKQSMREKPSMRVPSVRQNDSGKVTALNWRVQLLHRDNNEGLAVGDIDGDGRLDVTAGEYWYQAPDFVQRRVRILLPFGADYLQNNSEHLHDVDGDGDLDIVAGAFTSSIVNWFENPGSNYDSVRTWKIHQLIDTGTQQNEATFLEDIDGDGEPEWFENQWSDNNPTEIYSFSDSNGKPVLERHILARELSGHGQGFGDVNGDGLKDIVFKHGWFEHPKAGAFSGPWKYHDDFTLPHASCPILVLDLDGDGDSDLIWGDGHNYGLYWEEQRAPGPDGTNWRQHLIDRKFSQVHTLAWEDIDNDGVAELITGKRYYAHSGHDPGADDGNTVHYYDWLPATRSWKKSVIVQGEAGKSPGTGLQIRVADLDEDGWKDVVVPGKGGTYILWNLGESRN